MNTSRREASQTTLLAKIKKAEQVFLFVPTGHGQGLTVMVAKTVASRLAEELNQGETIPIVHDGGGLIIGYGAREVFRSSTLFASQVRERAIDEAVAVTVGLLALTSIQLRNATPYMSRKIDEDSGEYLYSTLTVAAVAEKIIFNRWQDT